MEILRRPLYASNIKGSNYFARPVLEPPRTTFDAVRYALAMCVVSGASPLLTKTNMATYGGITFNGKSGEKYYFKAWPLQTRFNPLGAVYFVTKRVFSDKNYRRASHESIFIGQTPDLTVPLATPLQLACFEKQGANCICVFVDASEERRLAVAQDLLAAHSTTCNDTREHRTRAQAEAEF